MGMQREDQEALKREVEEAREQVERGVKQMEQQVQGYKEEYRRGMEEARIDKDKEVAQVKREAERRLEEEVTKRRTLEYALKEAQDLVLKEKHEKEVVLLEVGKVREAKLKVQQENVGKLEDLQVQNALYIDQAQKEAREMESHWRKQVKELEEEQKRVKRELEKEKEEKKGLTKELSEINFTLDEVLTKEASSTSSSRVLTPMDMEAIAFAKRVHELDICTEFAEKEGVNVVEELSKDLPYLSLFVGSLIDEYNKVFNLSEEVGWFIRVN